jgi:hypothetical protein
MITFNDLKVGDKVLFVESFCQFEELTITKIDTEVKIKGRAQIYCEGGMSFYVVLKQSKSHTRDTKDGLHCGHIYTCLEAYKKAALDDLSAERAEIVAHIDKLKRTVELFDKDIDTVKAL